MPETRAIVHKVMIPPDLEGEVTDVVSDGEYTIEEPLLTLRLPGGTEKKLSMTQKWPIRVPRPTAKRFPATQPLITGQRILDTLFPLAKGGTAAVPGGFGTGKTMTQHQIAKWSDADIIVYIGCGERGNEMTQVLEDFSKLHDPKTGNPLMARTTLIANTSNMPVAAREASIYTGITLAEVGPDRKPIPGTQEHYDCDTLLLSVGLIPENELSRGIGVAMSPVTSGPEVNDCLETSQEGIFACGNVLHVHDLVDYVSEEASLAGKNAAAYVKAGEKKAGRKVAITAENGVRYTVPQTLDIINMQDSVTVRFRVADVYRDRYITVYYDGVPVIRRKKKVLAPGEMEQIVLKKESFSDYPELKNIVIRTEVE